MSAVFSSPVKTHFLDIMTMQRRLECANQSVNWVSHCIPTKQVNFLRKVLFLGLPTFWMSYWLWIYHSIFSLWLKLGYQRSTAMTMFSGNHKIFVGVIILTHRHTHSRSFKPNSPGDLSQLDLDRLVRTVLWHWKFWWHSACADATKGI